MHEALTAGQAVPRYQLAAGGPQQDTAIAHAGAEHLRAEAERAQLLAREQAARAEAEAAKRRLEALYRAAQQVSQSLSIEPVLASVVDAARRLFATDRVAICHEIESGRYVCAASSGLSSNYLETNCGNYMASPVITRAIATRSPVLIEDLSLVTPLPGGGELIARAILAEGVRSVLALPLIRQDAVIGTLSIYDDHPRTYAEDEVKTAEALASQAAIAIENARLYQTARGRAQEVEALLEATKQITSSLDLSPTLNSILDSIVRLCEADCAGVALLDASGTTLRYEAIRGPQAHLPEGLHPQLGQGLAGIAAQTGKAVNVADIRQDPRVLIRDTLEQAGIRSIFCLPLWSRARVIGVLVAMHREPAHFAPARERLLLGMGDQAALAIEHARLFAEVGMIEALKELERLKSEFIATVSHELRTPLGFIYGNAELLLQRDLADVDARAMVEDIYLGARELIGLVNDVIDIGRIERGEFELDLGQVNLRALLAETVAHFTPTATGHRLVTDLPAGQLLIRGDAGRLRQVILHLLSNAGRYSPNGGTVTVRATAINREVQFSIGDQGIGLAPEQLERVFEKFYRGYSAPALRHRAIGVGLTICRHVVEAHGGRISAESPGPGLGTTFHVALPVALSGSTTP